MKYCIFRIILAVFLYSGLQAQNTEYWILQDTYALKKDANSFTPFSVYDLEFNNGGYTRIGEYIVNDSLYYIAESNNVLNRIRQPMLGWTDTLDSQLKTNPWFLGFNYSDTVLMVTEKESRLTSIPRQSILQCSYIWNRGDNNKGEIFKTVVIDSGPFFPAYEPISEGYGSFITPIRMADNENWWIITYKFSRPTTTYPNIPISCKLIVYGLTKDSIWENAQFDMLSQMPNLPITTALPEIDYIAGSYQSVFNYNTNIVYLINEDIVLYRFDFSRSNGTIIGLIRDTLPGYSFQWNPYTNFPVMDVWTFTISPNGNYLYTLGVDSCRQFNLSASDPLLDMTIIPELCWEGYNNPTYLNYITYPFGVLSKDGKIFVFPVESVNSNVQWLNRSSYIARISNPDLPYPACGIDTLFYDTGIKLATGCFMNIADQYAGSPTAISEPQSILKITLAPNPAQTQATLTWSGVQQGAFVLRDMLGRAVLSEELNTPIGTIRLDLSALPKGIYLWQVQSDSVTKNGKLVVE
jgi:hypothetical protein